MPVHKFQFGNSQFAKPHIFEADMHNEALQAELPTFAELLFDDSLAKAAAAAMPALRLETGPAAKTLKFQYNAGSGGCFPWHYDNAGRPSRRAVTCIVYLNRDWEEGHGGELALAPFLRPEVVVPPLMSRAVLFLSDLVLHRVLPAVHERLCFSIWLDGAATNRDEDCNLTSRHLSTAPEAVELLRRSPVQRSLSRALYAEEYEASLRECMAEGPGCAEMLQAHAAHVRQQMSHPALGPFLEHLRSLKPRATEVAAG